MVYTGTDPLAFVLTKNLHRRHLSESQRAMVGSALANMKQGERTDLEPSADLRKVQPPVSQSKAAEMLNISDRLISTAKQVERDGVPELTEQVKAGEVSLHAASEVAKLPKDEQAAVERASKWGW